MSLKPRTAARLVAQSRYSEGRVLGRGSFGVVRLARDLMSNDQVVVKRVALEGDLDEVREEVRVRPRERVYFFRRDPFCV